MCGYPDYYESVDESILSTSCSKAMQQCSSSSCVRNYVRDAFQDRLYKFCKSDRMNLLVTAGSWTYSAYGHGSYYGNPYACIAYCEDP